MVLTQLVSVIRHVILSMAFPYHYGSHATLTVLSVCIQIHCVSIPLWFSRNGMLPTKHLFAMLCFHTTMVLTQPTAGHHRHRDIVVSIPLWFSRNEETSSSGRSSRESFHTTMVLTQRLTQNRALIAVSVFPYHYGSHATQYTSPHLWWPAFPYHYGSHATRR